jgi:hypothetical protein
MKNNQNSDLLGVESIFIVQLGDFVRVEQEIEVEGKKHTELGKPYEIRYYNIQNFINAVQSGRKFVKVEK